MVRQAVSLQPMQVHGGADIHLQLVQDPTSEQEDVSEGGCDPVDRLHWSRLLTGPVTVQREEPTLEQVCWQGSHGGPTLEQSVPEGLHPVEGTHAGAVDEKL